MVSSPRPVGELLRRWREHRRLSQLDLAIQADISTRHLSFLETGRSNPSREMVLHLSEELELSLRERNRLLLAAGYAPVFAETPLDEPRMAAVHTALRQILTGHDPYPAVVVDARWNLVDANASLALLTRLVSPELLRPPANVLRASLHPDGLAPHIVNAGEWRAHLLGRLRRQIAVTADPQLEALLAELRAYPCDRPEPEVEVPGPGDIVVPLRLRHQDGELTFFSTIATFGTPLDITVAELAIESFFPADPHTAKVLNDR
ncbi:transcriptional regulator [Sphaerisporangium rufum]|uniref:Transcriptional regulator n=2 Tax=Sphaerisporangium rufum TaxID=1381558 RepID=A0A919RAL8_9ACTN|nr:transcriptional regulator [Sphaerisporangium rufum]